MSLNNGTACADGHGSSGSDADGNDWRGRRPDSSFPCVDHHVPSSVHIDADLPSDDDDDHDVRISFVSAIGDRLLEDQAMLEEEEEEEEGSKYDYGMWMAAEPLSIPERRRLLLQGMGLGSSKYLFSLQSRSTGVLPPNLPRCVPGLPAQPQSPADGQMAATAPPAAGDPQQTLKQQPAAVITRRPSDSCLAVGDGAATKPPLSFRRANSAPSVQSVRHGSPVHKARGKGVRDRTPAHGGEVSGRTENVANGKESAVGDLSNGGAHNGLHSGLDEFEKFLGHNRIGKQLMRRAHSQPAAAAAPKGAKLGKKRGGWLQNIKSVAIGLIHEKDKDGNGKPSWSSAATMSKSAAATERLKVHHYGKSSKELTGLHMRQEIRAHEGSIWSIKFSTDGRRLASGGEDCVVRVWRVVDASSSSCCIGQDGSRAPPPLHPVAANWSEAPRLAAEPSKKARWGRSHKHALPEHVVVPETVFALAEQPVCAFEGHLEDVLDLSWSKSQHLLSSSMDKTVRLWDVQTKTCLKLFAHNDYVTCVQFNPVDDRYFISGSLDAKVRVWSIPERHVVDWSDLHAMVTAACYAPDGQGAVVGTHKGSCRFYKITDCKLDHEAQIDIAKKRKSQAKKITGFQFAPGNHSEVLVTSADSQIRVFDGLTMVQKFRGFKNTSSQIAASYTANGRYVVCASEDSHVYVWKRDAATGGGGGAGRISALPIHPTIGIGMKAKTWWTTRSYENFFCKDVSAAVPWPRSPSLLVHGESTRRGSSCSGRSPSSELHDDASLSGRSVDACGSPTRQSAHHGRLGSSSLDLAREPPLFSSRRHGSSKTGCIDCDGGNAWGLVVVTASLGGDIRVYQNAGLPVRIRGQSNLFH